MEKHLVLWEFSKKQEYIFKSNKLKEAVGASLIIKGLSENINDLGVNLKEENFIVRGGGKTIYSFDNDLECKEFVKNMSIKILKEYPGLEVFFVTEKYDHQKVEVQKVIENLYKKLEKKKAMRSNSAIQIGFGIEVPCESTGMPASENSENNKICSEIYLKRKRANKVQKDEFKSVIPLGYDLVVEMSDLINKEEKNYISVVHIDGNAMGKKVRKLASELVRKQDEKISEFNERYILAIRKFSLDITRKYEDAFIEMTKTIEANKESLENITKIKENKFPLRPLILAGDDVTFVTSGAIGVECAKVFIEKLKEEEIVIDEIKLGKLNACAGIAIVKSGYPFIKAYELCEELCKNAKRAVLENTKLNDASAIDFHISLGEITKSLRDIRITDYSFNGEEVNLTMKPLYIGEENEWRTYSNFTKAISNVKTALQEDNLGRNKIKALRNEFKKGPKNTEMFFKFYNIEPGKFLDALNNTEGYYCFNTKGNENVCMYLDAIEIVDYYTEL